MSARKTERLLNLVICLLATRRYLTAEQIRQTVAGYENLSDEAFKRKFERDKEELRELGIPLELGTNSVFDDEPGYRIPRDAYRLPDLTFTPAELTALALAARTWQQSTFGAPASEALRKLEAAGVPVEDAFPSGLDSRVATREPAFGDLWEAVTSRTAVRFDYRTPGAPREVEPWGLVSWHGNWYLAGFDRARGAERVFRLSRIVSGVERIGPPGSVTVPDGVDVRDLVHRTVSAADSPEIEVELLVRPDAGLALRRRAIRVEERRDGWDLVVIRQRGLERLVDEVLEYGADVVVAAPLEARTLALTRLRALVEG
ncbi:MAG: WYL domain-containing protein [Acidothermus cellulolyticus]|nr:WYL domain-containing protein [Acidothermus cellulolyticus]